MKSFTRVLTGILVASAFYVNAQGTLQFNQVILLTTSANVPAGKVWKVESVLGVATTTASNQDGSYTATLPASHTIVVGGSNVDVATALLGSASVSYGYVSNARTMWFSKEICTSLPIWLPEGTSLATGANVSSISVIEFNVIQ